MTLYNRAAMVWHGLFMEGMMAKYRIVTDEWLGYQAEYKTWWWPFWRMIGFANTHKTIESAKNQIEVHKSKPVWEE